MTERRTLFLHLGPPKTGSTFVQTAFELSREALADHRIDYPALPGAAWTGEGRSIYGNYPALFEALDRSRGGTRHLLISGESLVTHLADPVYVELLDRLRREAGFDALRGLLLPRDPVPQAAARHQQRVRNGGSRESVEASFSTFEVTGATLRLAHDLEGIGAELTLRSYDAVRSRLLDVVEEWLDLPPATLVRPRRSVVNRSMTRAELALQSRLNAVLPRRGRPGLLTPLVERLPDLTPHRALPSASVQEVLLDRVAPEVAALNARLPEDEQLDLGVLPVTDDSDEFVFTGAQLDELAQAIADELDRVDPFSRYRGRAPYRLARMVVRNGGLVARHARRRTPARLETSALRLTRTRGSTRRAARAAGLLVGVSALRRIVPQRRFARWVGPLRSDTTPFPELVSRARTEQEVSLAVRRAARWVPFGTSRLDHAITGSILLARRGIPSQVVLCRSATDPQLRDAALVTPHGLVGSAVSRDWVPLARFGPRSDLVDL